MGIVTGGVFGDVKNKVGNVVFSFWKGRNTIRKKAGSVANPRTTPQVNQRSKFSASSKFFSEILGEWVKPLWDRFSGNITGYNAIMKENTELFDNSGVPLWGDLVMSKGKMEAPVITDVVADVSTGAVTCFVDFPDDTAWGMDGSRLTGLLYNQTTGKFLTSSAVNGNPSDSVEVALASTDFVAGDVMRVYFAIKRADGTQVSDSATSSDVAVA